MNILFLSHNSSLDGGAERSLLELVKDSTDRGHNCIVIIPQSGKLSDEVKKLENTEVVYIAADWWARSPNDAVQQYSQNASMNAVALVKIIGIIESFKPDFCVTNTIVQPWLAYAAAITNAQHVWIIREGQNLNYRIPARHVYDTVGKLSSKVFCNSETTMRLFKKLINSKRELEVIYPYVSPPPQLLKTEKSPFNTDAELKLVHVGQIKPSKGQLDAVKAAISLNKKGIKTELLIVGNKEDENYVNEIMSIINNSGLEEQIRLVGHRSNQYTYLHYADMAIACSRNEPFGRIVVEAMLSKTPMIGADNSGIAEIISSDQTGMLYETGNSSDLESKILILHKNEELYENISAFAYREAKERFSIKNSHKNFFNYLTNTEIDADNTNLSPLLDLIAFTSAQQAESKLRETTLDHVSRELLEKTALLTSTDEKLQKILNSKSWKVASLISQAGRLVPSRSKLKNVLKRTYKALLKLGFFNARVYAGTKNSTNRTAIVMCTWRRIDNISDSLVSFANQNTKTDIDLFIWNNNRLESSKLHTLISQWDLSAKKGRLKSISVFNSRINVGGFGRFYMARKLAKRGYKYVLFIDDDQKASDDWISTATAFYQPEVIRSFWAFKMGSSNYSDRKRVTDPEKIVHYCGTGGMLVDTRIFLDGKLFECPDEYWFIEDIWLSFYAARRGWSLKPLPVNLTFMEDSKDQGILLNPKKHEFFKLMWENKLP